MTTTPPNPSPSVSRELLLENTLRRVVTNCALPVETAAAVYSDGKYLSSSLAGGLQRAAATLRDAAGILTQPQPEAPAPAALPAEVRDFATERAALEAELVRYEALSADGDKPGWYAYEILHNVTATRLRLLRVEQAQLTRLRALADAPATPTPAEAELAGMKAAIPGWPLSHNPYAAGPLADAWARGHKYVKDAEDRSRELEHQRSQERGRGVNYD